MAFVRRSEVPSGEAYFSYNNASSDAFDATSWNQSGGAIAATPIGSTDPTFCTLSNTSEPPEDFSRQHLKSKFDCKERCWRTVDGGQDFERSHQLPLKYSGPDNELSALGYNDLSQS